jgi:hypothetical protein
MILRDIVGSVSIQMSLLHVFVVVDMILRDILGGSHFAATVSTFQRRHEIERKRLVTKYQVSKITPRKET